MEIKLSFYRVIEHKFSKSPPRINKGMSKRRHSPPSPLSNSFDSETERMIEKDEREKVQQYQQILHYQMKEKELKSKLQKKESLLNNPYIRGKEPLLFIIA